MTPRQLAQRLQVMPWDEHQQAEMSLHPLVPAEELRPMAWWIEVCAAVRMVVAVPLHVACSSAALAVALAAAPPSGHPLVVEAPG